MPALKRVSVVSEIPNCLQNSNGAAPEIARVKAARPLYQWRILLPTLRGLNDFDILGAAPPAGGRFVYGPAADARRGRGRARLSPAVDAGAFRDAAQLFARAARQKRPIRAFTTLELTPLVVAAVDVATESNSAAIRAVAVIEIRD